MVTQVKLTATSDQVAEFEKRCELTEGLMAQTLAQRIEGMKADEAIPFIEDWFKSIRTMSVANHALSGIRLEAFEDGVPTDPSGLELKLKVKAIFEGMRADFNGMRLHIQGMADSPLKQTLGIESGMLGQSLQNLAESFSVDTSFGHDSAPEPAPPPAGAASPDLDWAKENREALLRILGLARNLCYIIEELPASEHQTRITILSSALASKVEDYVGKN